MLVPPRATACRGVLPLLLAFAFASCAAPADENPIKADEPDAADVAVVEDAVDSGEPDDAGAVDAVADTAAQVEVAQDTGPVPCKLNDDCAEDTPFCRVDTGKCVQCLTLASCSADKPVCLGGACAAKTTCTSDKHCLNLDALCDKTTGSCVDCIGDDDCSSGKCSKGSCVAKPKTCKSTKECATLGLVCNKTAGECVDCNDADDCTDAEFCSDNLCLPDTCKPGTKSCKSLTEAQVCADDGGTLTVTGCGKDKTGKARACEDGVCKDVICAPNKPQCLGVAIATCNARGVALTGKKDCPAGQVCKAGACVKAACKPGEKKCAPKAGGKASLALLLCKSDGLGWNEDKCVPGAESCGGAGVSAACIKHVCKPETIYCDGNKARRCAADGLSATLITDCAKLKDKDGKPAPGLCIGGECLPSKCKPASNHCGGNTAAICKVSGEGYSAVPCPDKQLCLAGKCQPVTCAKNEDFCHAFKLMKCNDKGDNAKLTTDCEKAGKGCKQGKCVALICKPGEAGCKSDGAAILTCKADGLGHVEVGCGAGKVCVPAGPGTAECKLQICTPNKAFCTYDTIKNWGPITCP